jgi:hypothetical protein
MTQTESSHINANEHAAAIARWNDDGGAPKSSSNNARNSRKEASNIKARTTNRRKEALDAAHRPNSR